MTKFASTEMMTIAWSTLARRKNRQMLVSSWRVAAPASAAGSPGLAGARSDCGAGESEAGARLPRIRASETAEMANEAASTAKAGVELVVETRMPPRTGPTRLPTWIIAADRPLPACSCSAGSRDGMIAAEAGRNRPSPAPISAATGPRKAIETRLRAAKTARTVTSTQRTVSAASITTRGLIRSARMPPTGISTVRGTP